MFYTILIAIVSLISTEVTQYSGNHPERVDLASYNLPTIGFVSISYLHPLADGQIPLWRSFGGSTAVLLVIISILLIGSRKKMVEERIMFTETNNRHFCRLSLICHVLLCNTPVATVDFF